MNKKKVLIFKNDRTGDLFVSLKAINRILNKHSSNDIIIFLSKINHKFNFLFPNIKKKVFSLNLNIIEKISIFFFILRNKVDTIYILSPKNFYYFLPIIFRKIKFYAITIKAKRRRPNRFLLRYLYKYVEIDRVNIKKRFSSYDIQESLIETIDSKNNLINSSSISHNFNYPDKFVIFHYKHALFKGLLNWDLDQTAELIEFLSTKFENVFFSSEIHNKEINNFFYKRFNTFDYISKKKNLTNSKKIYFLKDIDGYDLFDIIKKSSKVISPEGIMSHIGYYLKKPVLALMHFKIENRQDFINQIISCKEWFPPDNYQYTVLKKDFSKTIKKLNARI